MLHHRMPRTAIYRSRNAGKIADNRAICGIEPEHDDQPACLIFPQKAARTPADDDGRLLFAVFFHMDAGAIPGITANVDRAAAHGIAHGIADASAHDDFAVIHGVPDGILCVSDNIDAPAAEIDLPPQVTKRAATKEDLAQILPYLMRFCAEFSHDPEELAKQRYTVIVPNSKTPYKQMYVAN